MGQQPINRDWHSVRTSSGWLKKRAKHECMNMSSSGNKDPGFADKTRTGAGLPRATKLLRKLRAAAEVSFGRSLTYDELSDYTGEARSTLGRWFNGDGDPSPEILLRLLELTSEKNRHEIMDKPPFCRVHPRIDHPYLEQDSVATSILGDIVSNLTGLTLVQGDTDASATFVATAIAHSARMMGTHSQEVVGLDIHKPDWFVPIPGVQYLNALLPPAAILKQFDLLWTRFVTSRGAILLLNGVFHPVAAAPQKVFQLARQSHLVIASKVPARGTPAHPLPGSATVITVTTAKHVPDRFTLEARIA